MTRDSRSFKGVKKLNNRKRPLSQKNLACVASVSNRVIARKLERKHIHFFLLFSQLSRRTSRGNACYAGYKKPSNISSLYNLTNLHKVYFRLTNSFLILSTYCIKKHPMTMTARRRSDSLYFTSA